MQDPKKKEQARVISTGDSRHTKDTARSRNGSKTYQENSTAFLFIDDSTNKYDLTIALPDGVLLTEQGTGRPPVYKVEEQQIGEGASKVDLKNIPLPGPGQTLSGTVDLTKDLYR